MPEAHIQFASEKEYDRLCQIRDSHGVTWRGMLLEGAKRVENHELKVAMRQLTHAFADQQEPPISAFTATGDSE